LMTPLIHCFIIIEIKDEVPGRRFSRLDTAKVQNEG